MAADGFQVARLIPVSGIANNVEAEMRATSALLSVLTAVRDLSTALTVPLGASGARRATVQGYIETVFKLADGTVVRPDGLIRVTYGASTWQALVEVKTGKDRLAAEQVRSYLAVAREQGIDAVLTISNEIAVGDRHPCEGVRVASNARVALAHCSWTEVLAHAVRAKVHRGVDDPEQAWILGELIRYLEHPASGAMAFDDMGVHWADVRDAAREGTLHKGSPEARDVALRWDQLIRFAALRLGSETGADVQPVVPRAHGDARARLAHLTGGLATTGVLDGAIRVPGAAGPVHVTADLRARQVAVDTTVAAPDDRGNRGRITWLVRQIEDEVSDDVLVEAWPKNARQPLSASLGQVREDRDLLLDPDRRDILRFRLVQRAEMGRNRKDGGRTPGFAQSVTGLIERFYETVVQDITPWTARPPQTRPAPRHAELVDEAIEDRGELGEAIEAADAHAADEMVEAPIAATPTGRDGDA